MRSYGQLDLSKREEKTKKIKKPIYKRWWFWAIAIIVLGTIGTYIEIRLQQESNHLQISSNQSQINNNQFQVNTDQNSTKDTKSVDGAKNNKSVDEVNNAKKVKNKFYGIGETAETDKVRGIISSIEKVKRNKFNKPDEGKEFVLLNITIENISNSDILIGSMFNFTAYVDDVAVNESLSAQIAKKGINAVNGTVAPGKKIAGTLAYELDKDWKQMKIYFASDLWEGTEIKWLIENE